MTDFKILSAPRISIDTFTVILTRGGSPAAPVAAQCYRSIVKRGVDPALALAVFEHESSFGRLGAANPRRNWGNLRRSPYFKSDGRFVVYPSWSAGAADAARLLSIYGRNAIRRGVVTDSARTFPHVWAPSADGNRPKQYGEAIVRAIQRYQARERQRHPDGRIVTSTGGAALSIAPNGASAASVPGTIRFISRANHVRLRSAPDVKAPITRTVNAGIVGSARDVVHGTPYDALGEHGTSWIELVAVGGRRLPGREFSARVLWRHG
jgi:hypothetical protein